MIKVFVGVLLALQVAGLVKIHWSYVALITVGALLANSLMIQFAMYRRKQMLEKTTADIEKDSSLDDESKVELLYLGLLTLILMKN
jgi:hypothetical protein